MVAGIWFHWMPESDLRRVISPGGVLIFLLPPGFVPFLQMTIVLGAAVLGQKVGETVSYQAPNGKTFNVEILKTAPNV